MKKLLTLLALSLVVTYSFAYDIAVENADGVTIYYKYINNGTELEVTHGLGDYSLPENYYNVFNNPCLTYVGTVVIPEEVVYMNRTRKVTSIDKQTFCCCTKLSSLIIPNSVTRIGKEAFKKCRGLTSIVIPNNVTSIDESVFFECMSLKSIAIPNSVTSIGSRAFSSCGLTSIDIPNSVKSIGDGAFLGCEELTNITIPNGVTSIRDGTFYECYKLRSIAIPNSVTSIGGRAFSSCGLTSIDIPNSVKSIGKEAFYGCINLSSITIPSSVTSIGGGAFSGWNLPVVISRIENPISLPYDAFTNDTFKNATLYVPVGTVDKYKATKCWDYFLFIEEGDGGETPISEKCQKPTINYQNGRLIFNCETEGAICHSTITDADIKSYVGNEIQLGVTYSISVYATKSGCENSDVATATLCWIDTTPHTEGISNGLANISSNAVLVKANHGQINVEGALEGTTVTVYDINGMEIGSAASSDGIATISTNLPVGSIAIIKIKDKCLKILIR